MSLVITTNLRRNVAKGLCNLKQKLKINPNPHKEN